MPPALTVALSQMFAFGFETLILWGLLRGRLAIRQIVPITLLANIVSFTAGWFLLPIIG